MNVHPVRSVESAAGEVRRARFVSRETARLLPILLPTALAGFALLGVAIFSFAASGPSAAVLGGVLALLLAATFVEAHPVPIEGISSEGISLAAVFIVGTGVIYGWAPAVIMGFLTRALIEVVQRRPADPPFVQRRRLRGRWRGGRRSQLSRGERGGSRLVAPPGAARGGRVLRGQHPAHRGDHLALGTGAVSALAQALHLLDRGARSRSWLR